MSAALPMSPERAIATPVIRPARLAGFAGLAFALIVGAVNIVVGAMSPPAYDATASEIIVFVAGNETVLATVVGAVPFAVVALFVFLAGVYPVLGKASIEAALWTRVGAVGIVLVEVMFLTRLLFELALIANVETLTTEPALTEALWRLQGAAMIINGLALAVALLGLSRAARLSGLIPGWQAALGLGAALAFFIAAVAAVPSLGGSPIGLLGLPAFAAWLIWLALTSVRLLRAGDETA